MGTFQIINEPGVHQLADDAQVVIFRSGIGVAELHLPPASKHTGRQLAVVRQVDISSPFIVHRIVAVGVNGPGAEFRIDGKLVTATDLAVGDSVALESRPRNQVWAGRRF
jgi:hypothetical protein